MKKNKKINNKGFTLIEVLAVIVILVIIVAIAIPNISASLDRQTCKTTENKAKLIESAAQFYVSDNRNDVKDNLDIDKKCKIESDKLIDDKYINNDDLIDGNNQPFSGFVIYNQEEESYNFCFELDSCNYNNDSICDSTDNNCY